MSPENEQALAAAALTDRRIDPELQRSLAAHARRLVARVEELEKALADVLVLEPRESERRPARCIDTAAESGLPCPCYSCTSARWYTAKRRAAELLERKEGSQ